MCFFKYILSQEWPKADQISNRLAALERDEQTTENELKYTSYGVSIFAYT